MEGDDQKLIINVTPANEFYGGKIYSPDDEDSPYKNHSMPRGLIFLANYNKFDPPPKTGGFGQLQARYGSEIDVKNLVLLFTQSGYKVPDVNVDMTKEETVSAITKFTSDPELEKVDSCVVILISHGNDNYFVTRDHQTLTVDDVLYYFSNRACPALKGKPKYFILDFCRGLNCDKGKGLPINFEGSILQRSYSDMFLTHATIPGHTSFFDTVKGSLLIQCICDIFMKNAYKEELIVLMRKVNIMLGKKTIEYGDKVKQTCEITMYGFDKAFYFNPRPLNDTYLPSSLLEGASR